MVHQARILIRGIVQGIGFRPFIYHKATQRKLTGYVRNLGDATVEVIVQGEYGDIEGFLKDIRARKPSLAQIYGLQKTYEAIVTRFQAFTILESSDHGTESGSVIPFDVGICDDCLADLRDEDNKRHNYFFTTCTQCGPRYTIVQRVPYDRGNTTMSSFQMCPECTAEYRNPTDRRFHAQTIACPSCGPKLFLTDRRGERIITKDPAREAGQIIAEGAIIAVKGNGGFHIAASTTLDRPLQRLREIKHRAQKPFAIMSPNLDAIRTFAEVNKREKELLSTPSRPIVLLVKCKDFYLSGLVSPGLHNIGVMLPYTGLHYMLFDKVEEPAFVMTSANPPNEPMVIGNEEAYRKLGEVADYFLMHNREIAQRCDDSVLRLNCNSTAFIRRSRGYVPAPIFLSRDSKMSVLALGAEENVNSCVLIGNRAFISQHIGDIEKLETYNFLNDATCNLLRLTKARVGRVACDLHPGFITSNLARRFADEFRCDIIPIQHHHAHVLSVIAEKGLEDVIGVSCDGAGYGPDGSTWGGEVLHCTGETFRRVGHLQPQPLLGGDLAARYPIRMAAGILGDTPETRDWLHEYKELFPHGEQEFRLILNQLKSGRSSMTTSCGRVLDAVSAVLGLCMERTYEGEPAMKLESAALKGSDVLGLVPQISNMVLDTTVLLRSVFEQREKLPTHDLAYSAEEYLAQGLATMASENANKAGIREVVFSGGVAYNSHICTTIEKTLKANGLHLVLHEFVPPGDGGISLGQAFAASYE